MEPVLDPTDLPVDYSARYKVCVGPLYYVQPPDVRTGRPWQRHASLLEFLCPSFVLPSLSDGLNLTWNRNRPNPHLHVSVKFNEIG